MKEVILIIVGIYALLQAYAAVIGWRRRLILSWGALVTMVLGSGLMVAGVLLDHPDSILGVILIGVGLYFISDAAYYIGTKRPNGPRYRHHVIRAVVGMVLIMGLLVA